MKTTLNYLFCSLILLTFGCTKEVVTARDYPTQSLSKYYRLSPEDALDKSSAVLTSMDYKILTTDNGALNLITGWVPTQSGSHYMNVFDRKDFAAATGSYYQLLVKVVPQNGYVRIDMQTNVKGIAGKLESTRSVETEFFKKLDDVARGANIKITNVGVTN